MAVTFQGHQQSFGQELNSLLHCSSFVENEVKSMVYSGLVQSGEASLGLLDQERIRFNREDSTDESPIGTCQDVCGSDIGDIPTHYVVKDLQPQEHPVIGTYIDSSILPGFKYQIRLLGSRKYLFEEKPLTLVSIGMGYGRRITMDGAKDNYFYSDTHADGCGFQIVAVEQGDRFIIRNGCDFPIGEAAVEFVQLQKEVSSDINLTTKAVQKVVSVSFTCSVKYSSEPHGLLSLCANKAIQVSALAFLQKSRGSNKASVTVIKNIHLQRYGSCTFHPCV